MSIKIECNICNCDLDNNADTYCGRCFMELEDMVSNLEKEIDDLNSDLVSLEKELAAKE